MGFLTVLLLDREEREAHAVVPTFLCLKVNESVVTVKTSITTKVEKSIYHGGAQSTLLYRIVPRRVRDLVRGLNLGPWCAEVAVFRKIGHDIVDG